MAFLFNPIKSVNKHASECHILPEMCSIYPHNKQYKYLLLWRMEMV